MRKRSILIPIRVTEKELTTIETKATKAGMNRTDYLIACAVGKRITVIDDLTPLLRLGLLLPRLAFGFLLPFLVRLGRLYPPCTR